MVSRLVMVPQRPAQLRTADDAIVTSVSVPLPCEFKGLVLQQPQCNEYFPFSIFHLMRLVFQKNEDTSYLLSEILHYVISNRLAIPYLHYYRAFNHPR